MRRDGWAFFSVVAYVAGLNSGLADVNGKAFSHFVVDS